jgi:hypothetical protein
VRRPWAKEEVDVVPRGPHSPIPRVDELPAELWERPSPLRGVQFDREAQVRRFEALEPRIRDFPPIEGFQLWNGSYEAVDAEVLWAILSELRPQKVVELGSGWSSKVIAAAIPPGCDYRAYDLHPPLEGVEAERVAPQRVPEAVFAGLRERDVLFVDTTHTVKTGGDVNRIVLDLLPLLAPGVLVHFHDVLLPWELPRTWLERGRFWSEQYLLQAFLSGNADWEVLLGLHDLARTEPALVKRIVPSWRGTSEPSAFWIRRCPD